MPESYVRLWGLLLWADVFFPFWRILLHLHWALDGASEGVIECASFFRPSIPVLLSV